MLTDHLRRPEYTGENRCAPCTLVNLVVAAVVALAVWFLLPAGVAPALAAIVFVSAVAAIYLRGYLVPGTPWLTRTYFPDWLLRVFDKQPIAASASVAPEGEFDVESALEDAGAVTECADADDLCLAAEFRDAWRATVETIRREDDRHGDLATALGDGLAVEERGETLVARDEGVVVGQWESEAAFLADVAAARVLSERYPVWAGLDLQFRGAVLNGLRLFVERCPACDGRVTMDEEVVRSCCRSRDVVAVTCEDCAARLFEADVPEAA